MRSCFLKRICALTASSEYIAGCSRNPALCTSQPKLASYEQAGEGHFTDVGFHQGAIKERPVFVTSSLIMEAFAATSNAPLSGRCSNFHRHWCNSRRAPKSIVNRALQRPPNVLPSGPFKKSFQASHGAYLSTAPDTKFSGADHRQPSIWSIAVGRKAKCFAPTENRCQNDVDEPSPAVN